MSVLNPSLWVRNGQLRDEVVQDIADRLRRGETRRNIAAAIGLSEPSCYRVCGQISRMLGLFSIKEQRVKRAAEVARRFEAGESRAAIASATGESYRAIQNVLKAQGLTGRLLRLTPDQHAEMERRLHGGDTSRGIAEDLGCSTDLVRQTRKRLGLTKALASCLCGLPHEHRGKCRQRRPEVIEITRARLMRGDPLFEISQDLGLIDVTRYHATLLSELRSKGVKCRCGGAIGHGGNCLGHKSKKLSDEELAKARALIRAGATVATVEAELGLTSLQYTGTKLRRELAAEGVKCPCGRPLNHHNGCAARASVAGAISRERSVPPPPRRRKLADPKVFKRVRLLYQQGISVRKINADTGVSRDVLRRLIAHWQLKNPLGLCACGRPDRHPGGCMKNSPGALSEQWLERIDQMVRDGETPHQIARKLDLHVKTVFKRSARVRAELFAQGITCACGRVLGHRSWCTANWEDAGRLRAHQKIPRALKARVRADLLAGVAAPEIAKAAGLTPYAVQMLLRELAPSERQVRAAAIQERIWRQRPTLTDDMLAVVEAAVPKSIDRMVRDDIVAELHLALLEGRLEPDQIRSAVRSFVSRGLSQWQSAYGPRSLNGAAGPDDDRQLVDLIRDDTSADLIDEIRLGIEA